MNRPNAAELRKFLDFLSREAPNLGPPTRWLSVAADLGNARAAVILDGLAEPPKAAELTDLLRLLQRKAPELAPFGRWLASYSDHWEDVCVELQLDLLIAADIDGWEHPTQVLERPRPDFEKLLEACRERARSAADENRELLEHVEAKVERAVSIAASARQRRERMRRRRRR